MKKRFKATPRYLVMVLVGLMTVMVTTGIISLENNLRAASGDSPRGKDLGVELTSPGLQVELVTPKGSPGVNDPLSFRVRPNRPAYLYLFQMDDKAQKATLVFPQPGSSNTRVEANREVSIPSKESPGFMARRAGQQRMVLIAATRPIALESKALKSTPGGFSEMDKGAFSRFLETVKTTPKTENDTLVKEFDVSISEGGGTGGGKRALIVSIGQGYAANGINVINGPEKDAMLATALAKEIGFSESEMKIIREGQATKAAILQGLDWVKQGVDDGGKALIYYSGHGSRVPDLTGSCAGALVPVDGVSPERLLVENELHDYLTAMSDAKEIILVLDSCFSGAIEKSVYGGLGRNVKYFSKAGAPQCDQAVNKSPSMVDDRQPVHNLVVLAATASNEVAYGDITEGNKGSLFTQAINDTLLQEKGPLSYRSLRDEAATRVKMIADSLRRIPHTPQLKGNPALFSKDIRMEMRPTPQPPTPDPRPPKPPTDNRQLLEQLVNHSKFMVALRWNNNRVKLNEKIQFSVISSENGYLNLIEVEPNGNLNVIFPNKYVSENRVSADGELKIPESAGRFKFVGREPLGESLVVALVTKEPLNLYTEANIGTRLGDFKSINARQFPALKALVVETIQKPPSAAAPVPAESVAVVDPIENAKEFGAQSMTLEVVR